MKRLAALVALSVTFSLVGCKKEEPEREQEQAKQARAEADEKAFAIARETEHKTALINDKVARYEAEVKRATGDAKLEAERKLADARAEAEKNKQELIDDAAERIEEDQKSAEREEKQAYPASPEERQRFQRTAERAFEQIEQRALELKRKISPKDEQHAALDGIVAQARQARANLGTVHAGDEKAYRATRATLEKQLSNLNASLDQLGSRQ